MNLEISTMETTLMILQVRSVTPNTADTIDKSVLSVSYFIQHILSSDLNPSTIKDTTAIAKGIRIDAKCIMGSIFVENVARRILYTMVREYPKSSDRLLQISTD